MLSFVIFWDSFFCKSFLNVFLRVRRGVGVVSWRFWGGVIWVGVGFVVRGVVLYK